jgi:POT family proton-dependent oligopeptide transporter
MTVLSVYLLVTGKRAGKVQFQRNIAMLLLFLANTCFWALFEQAGSSLNVFAREFTTPMFGDATSWREGGFAIFQSLNPLYILLFAPVFAAAWPKLEKMGMNPSTPRKFALALFQVTAGFYLLVLAVSNMQNAAGLVPWIFLALCYLLHTTGELCLSPIGLSMVTKLADEKETGVAMGGWFMSIAMAQYVGGLIAYLAAGGGGHGVSNGLSITQYSSTFMQLVWLGLAFGIVYLIAAPAINKLMHGVK